MIGISLKIFYDGLISIIHHNEVAFSWWLIIACILTILTKLFLYVYTKNAYKKHFNLLLK